jgi:ketol-acid reductoisomerase
MVLRRHRAAQLYAEAIAPNLVDGDALFFAHGLNIRYGYITPPAGVDVCMVAPKGPGHLVRRQFEEGRGVPVLVAVEQDATGNALGARAVLRQGHRRHPRRRAQDHVHRGDRDRPVRRAGRALRRRDELIKAGFETLTEAGYQPEAAYFECLHELKLIVDLMYEGGIAKMRWSVSDTAEYGDYTRGPRVINDETKRRCGKILGEIQDGTFAREVRSTGGTDGLTSHKDSAWHHEARRRRRRRHRSRGGRRGAQGPARGVGT